MASDCPHHLFQDGGRASKGKAHFNLDAVEIKAKHTHAQRTAHLVLQTVTSNYRRHDELQRFMLATDSVTVAVEVPVFLTPDDITHIQHELGFHIPIPADTTLTGHIDVLQIRNGGIHILDYKPNARREKPIAQLMTYALALSRRTGLRLFDFTCAWFDEHDYFEFFRCTSSTNPGVDRQHKQQREAPQTNTMSQMIANTDFKFFVNTVFFKHRNFIPTEKIERGGWQRREDRLSTCRS